MVDRAKDEVKVVRHEAVSVEIGGVTLKGFLQKFHIMLVVLFISE
nr:hypothetical protein [Rossellomorea marisflavi]